MINSISKNLKFICIFISIGFITGILYAFIMFQPIYKSEARILTSHKSVLTQVYILKSEKFAQKVWEKIKEKYDLDISIEEGTDKVKNAVNAERAANTSVIDISAAWSDPIVAKEIASTIIAEYKNLVPELVILDAPNVPFQSTFPSRIEVVALFILFSGIVAIIMTIFNNNFKRSYKDADEIEKDLKIPVLSAIPWLEQEIYDEPDIMFAIDESASFYSLAYQKAVSCLKLRSKRSNKNVFAFTSSEFSKFRSTIIMNIAYGLSRTGESVVIIDADFRTPSIGNELGLKSDAKGDLTQLLTDSSGDIERYIYSMPGIKNFHIIPNYGNSADPSLYLYSEAFKTLIQKLKASYDYIFIDIPPVLAVPDTFMLGNRVDGVILITGVEPYKPVLRSIQNQLTTYGMDIFGIITREIKTREAISANVYLKQMISRIMSRNHELITE